MPQSLPLLSSREATFAWLLWVRDRDQRLADLRIHNGVVALSLTVEDDPLPAIEVPNDSALKLCGSLHLQHTQSAQARNREVQPKAKPLYYCEHGRITPLIPGREGGVGLPAYAVHGDIHSLVLTLEVHH